MANARFSTAGRGGQMASPRPKTRDTVCRNVLIYGHCRYEDQGCAFNHDQNKNSNSSADNSKKALNVDSPSFTPAQLPGMGGKKSTFSTNATPFTPRGAPSTTNSTLQQDAGNPMYKAAPFSDFTPSNYDLNTASTANGTADTSQLGYDPFSMSSVGQSLPGAQFNPYADDHAGLAGASGAMFAAAQNAFSAPLQPLSYHLYYPITPVRESLQPYQRQVHEFFLPEQIREELQKKSEAARQVMSTMQLPSPAHYHSLVPLDTKPKATAGFFGFISWAYKACSRKTGNVYCLRRIEGFRLTNEDAFVRNVAAWKKISHPNVVTVVEAFTTRDFGDSSLVFVHHYHPLSKTLAEHHFSPTRYARGPSAVPEKILWGYMVQIASALRTIHQANLSARCIDISKVIITDKNHVRLSSCSIVDVLQNDVHRPLDQLQQDDFVELGKLILGIATTTLPNNIRDPGPLLDQLGRAYSQELKDRVTWLLSPPQPTMQKNAESLLWYLSNYTMEMLEDSMRTKDDTTAQLSRELENGRLFRLLAKLGTINERPEFDGDPSWSETSERYTLKLFRDYVFHQVDTQGNPVVDMGHIITCLNKLDAGIDEKVYLTSRDHQSVFIVSYRELKKQVNTAFGDLFKSASTTNSSKTQPPGRTY